jgi:tRNA (uracil-5-)-methyltransferase TRM9
MHKNTADLILEKVMSDYNNIAEHFSQTRYKDWSEFLDFKRYLKNNFTVLDVGCGNGRLLNFLADYNIEYVGVDASERLVKIAKKLADENINNSNLQYKFIESSAIKLPFADNSFDVVFAIASLYHVPSKKYRNQAVSEISRVLKKNGIFIMTYWNMWERTRRKLIADNIVKKIIGKSKLDFFDAEKPWKNPAGDIVVNRYCHAFRLREIEHLATKNNFETLDKYYMKKGERVGSKNGYNGIYIAKKG